MPGGLPRHRYVEALTRAVDAATAGFVPDLILVSSGFDSLLGDPLGGFTLQLEDMEKLTGQVVTMSDSWCGGRVSSGA